MTYCYVDVDRAAAKYRELLESDLDQLRSTARTATDHEIIDLQASTSKVLLAQFEALVRWNNECRSSEAQAMAMGCLISTMILTFYLHRDPRDADLMMQELVKCWELHRSDLEQVLSAFRNTGKAGSAS